ncbi:MAG: HDIG domain-containing protein, partial [Elusimicrobiota bacterium]|nr:HDIG domain-containing protein [Elusimicrobiota bacterium]
MRALGQIIYQAAPCAYYVGGSVRDGILKRRSADIDLALPKNFVKPASVKLARLLRASAFEMDAGFCVWRVTLKTGLQIDLSALIGKDIYEDLRRRDFTVNAMACPTAALPLVDVDAQGRVLLKNLKKAQVIDLNGGFADIKAKTIRANAANIFTEDPLRLLRAFRAAAELNFKIAPATLAQIKKHSALISKPAGERVQEELKRIFAQNNTAARLADMDKARLLTAVFPALEDQKTTARVYYGKGGVFTHTLLVAQRVEYLLNHLKTVYPQFYKRLLPFVGDAALYKMAALLHDIAKPKTAKVIKDRLRFFYHEEKGAKM